jgi:DNA (cytosine-5-)-methyltransferase
MSSSSPTKISTIDLFCGAGGLSLGLKQVGIKVAAGIDLDPTCSYPYSHNIGADFIQADVSTITGRDLWDLWMPNSIRLLAGCAPCQPFSSQRRGVDTREEKNWSLLAHFGRLVNQAEPELVTMENVTRLASQSIFKDFVSDLRSLGYNLTYGTLYGPGFGLPQERRRLVLMASRIGEVSLPRRYRIHTFRTVRQAIGELPDIKAGDVDPDDALHRARALNELNLTRLRSSKPGGTWRDWPEELRAPCHRRSSGSSFGAFYGRMEWDKPSPTVTTQFFNLGTGRFGHPEQDRAITLREAAILQGFPRGYQFVPPNQNPVQARVGRLIGNAVPPAFGRAIGREFLKTASRGKK